MAITGMLEQAVVETLVQTETICHSMVAPQYADYAEYCAAQHSAISARPSRFFLLKKAWTIVFLWGSVAGPPRAAVFASPPAA